MYVMLDFICKGLLLLQKKRKEKKRKENKTQSLTTRKDKIFS